MARTTKTKFNPSQAFATATSMSETSEIRTFVSLPQTDADLVHRSRNSTPFSDVKTFCNAMVRDAVSWLRRMVCGTTMFELSTMTYWRYDEEENVLLLSQMRSNRTKPVKYSMAFTEGDIDQYNIGMGSILNSFWYKTYAFPLAVVELIAACDLLYRKNHNGRSPAHAAGIPHIDLD